MSVARNTIYNAVGMIVPLAVTLVVTPRYLHVIGTPRYGVLAIFWTLFSALSFFSVGMGPALCQRLAAAANAQTSRRSEIAWTALLISLMAAIAGGMVVLAAAHVYFASFAKTPASLQDEIRRALPLLAISFSLQILSGVFNGAMQGRERFGLLNAIQAVTMTLTAVVPLCIAYFLSPELGALLVGTIGVNLISLAVQLTICIRIIPLRIPVAINRPDVRGLLDFGSWATVNSIIGALLVYWDRFLLGALLGAAAVTLYVVPFNVAWQIVALPTALASAMFPKFAAAELSESHRLRARALSFLEMVMTPITLLAIFAAPPFLFLWLHPSLGSHMAPVACILLFGLWTNSFARIPNAHLQARGRPKAVALFLLAQALPYLGVLYLFVHWFGVPGAAAVWSFRCLVDTIGQFVLDGGWRRASTSLFVQGATILVAVLASISLPALALVRLIVAGLFVTGAAILMWRTKAEELTDLIRLSASWTPRVRGLGAGRN